MVKSGTVCLVLVATILIRVEGFLKGYMAVGFKVRLTKRLLVKYLKAMQSAINDPRLLSYA